MITHISDQCICQFPIAVLAFAYRDLVVSHWFPFFAPMGILWFPIGILIFPHRNLVASHDFDCFSQLLILRFASGLLFFPHNYLSQWKLIADLNL